MPKKRHRRDRHDGYYISGLDPMHQLMPYMLPNRADNEAVVNEFIDLTAINEFLDKKNANLNDELGFKYTLFHVICAAMGKTIHLRPHMNRFIIGKRFYQRKEISLSFVVKKLFTEQAVDALAIVKLKPESELSPLDQVHGKVREIVHGLRKSGDGSGKADADKIMETMVKMPRPILSAFIKLMRKLSDYDRLPKAISTVDPYHTSAFIANLGSIKLSATYHHLANWGTNSLFLVIGEKQDKPYFDSDANAQMRQTVELGLTIDERIGNGYYFAATLRLLRVLLANPELLELPMDSEVEY